VLEEINTDYVRTARSKGVAGREVLLTHVMRNVMIPVLTNTVTALPTLLLGALILERLFQIPGVGGLLVESVFNQDRPVVMALTYALSIMYCVMLLVTDICYTLVDPRVSLK
jgi:peptide/nickel transport system permease protein